MRLKSAVPEQYDPYVAFGIMILVVTVGVIDISLYCLYGQPYTISAYLRRVMTAYPAVLSVVSFSIGALFAHIFLSR